MPDSDTSVVTPITATPLPDKVPLAEARAAGRFGHDKPTVDNSIVLLIDHQVGLLASTRDTSSAAELKSNIVDLARVAKALGLPTMIASSNAQWQNGDILPEIKALFPDTPVIRRTGIICNSAVRGSAQPPLGCEAADGAPGSSAVKSGGTV